MNVDTDSGPDALIESERICASVLDGPSLVGAGVFEDE